MLMTPAPATSSQKISCIAQTTYYWEACQIKNDTMNNGNLSIDLQKKKKNKASTPLFSESILFEIIPQASQKLCEDRTQLVSLTISETEENSFSVRL